VIDLFVYGTLKPGEVSYHLCASQVVRSQSAVIEGSIYHLPLGYPAVTLEQAGRVLGRLLSFADDQILLTLDEYEAHAPEVLERHLPGILIEQVQYNRQQVQTFSADSNHPLTFAWIYTMTLEQIHCLSGVLLPDGVWHSNQDYRTF